MSMEYMDHIRILHDRDVASKGVGWINTEWPVPPGVVPFVPGVYWIDTHGSIALGLICDSGADLLVSLFSLTGQVIGGWAARPWREFYDNARMLYTAWRPIEKPLNGWRAEVSR